jgi:glycosyltransferase involved in cell wall biosynthesis
MIKAGNTLVILTPAFASDEDDSYLPSQERFIRSLNKNFPSLKIIILTFHFPVVKDKTYQWHGNEVIAFNGAMKGGFNSLILWKQVWERLLSFKKTRKIIGIFSFFCSESAFIGHYFSKRNDIVHRIWILGQDAARHNKQVKRIRPLGEELIAISDFLVREFERNHGIKPKHVIPIGIAPEDYDDSIFERSIDVLGVGSLSPIKRYDWFVDIVADLAKTIPDIRAVICGNGSEMDSIRAQINDAEMQDNIKLPGQQKPPEALKLMQHSKILLHTSSYEGFGMVCTEALYAGAHVISFLKPMNANIKHWHIVNSKNDMVEKALEILLNDATKYTSVLPYSMDDTAIEIMKCFGYFEG